VRAPLNISPFSTHMLASRLWPRLVLGCLLYTVSAVPTARAQGSPAPHGQNAANPAALDPEEQEEQMEIEELEEEVGDRDPTYLRTRVVGRYDRRLFEGSAASDRLRLRFLYALGPKQRFAVSFLEPLVRMETSLGTARGSGDAELQANANIVYCERFRAGVGVQATLQTSSDALLGGNTTTLKPSLDFTGVLSSRLELVVALYYRRSIHTSRGDPFDQFEPDLIVNARVFNATWFLEWDSYYDFRPGRYAQTLKPGISRAFGPRRHWVASAYYAVGLNDYARRSQYRYNAGIDLTWYPRKYR